MADEPVNEEEAQAVADFEESRSEPMAAKASESDKDADQFEKPNASSAEKKPIDPKRRTHTIIAIAVVVAALLGGGAYWYVNYQIPHQKAVEAFNAAVTSLDSRTAEVDAAIADLQALQGGADKPLDETVDAAASNAIGQAQAAKQTAPEMPKGTDAINEAAKQVDGMGDYTGTLSTLATAKQALQDSIDQLKQVTNPSEAFVIERITGLENITGAEAVTETNDPNGRLGKAGGYTAAVYFSSDLVNRSDVYPSSGYTGIVADGNEGGGCVEVYETVEDATKRDEYLSAFDGNALLSPGSHEVLGTCVIRTSDKLTASQQKAIAQEVKESLVRLN